MTFPENELKMLITLIQAGKPVLVARICQQTSRVATL
jgi:hypothetical protein